MGQSLMWQSHSQQIASFGCGKVQVDSLYCACSDQIKQSQTYKNIVYYGIYVGKLSSLPPPTSIEEAGEHSPHAVVGLARRCDRRIMFFNESKCIVLLKTPCTLCTAPCNMFLHVRMQKKLGMRKNCRGQIDVSAKIGRHAPRQIPAKP